MDRIILHSDCNSFFASVECVMHPELKDVPMAVAGDKESRHGIILAKNELAKKFGVKTAEPIWQARKKCPNLVTVPPRHELYAEYSEKINKIYIDYTDLVEKFSIDESWLDVTGSTRLFGDGKTIADTIRERVKKEVGISVSVGVSFNKIFAKLGSDYKKPDATTVIDRENFKKILYPLPVTDMLYVGKSANEVFLKCNIKTIGDLAAQDPVFLAKKIGKIAFSLVKYAKGEDTEPVKHFYEKNETKSIGKGMTFSRDIAGRDDIARGVMTLSETIARKMREENIKCGTICVHIKDPELKTTSRQRTLAQPTYLAKDIFEAAMNIITSSRNVDKPIRMLTVTGTNFIKEEAEQISLFDSEETNKRENLERAIDKIRSEYGKGSIVSANVIDNDIGIDYKD